MTQNPEFEKFITYGIEKILTISDFVKLGLMIIVLSLPAIIIEGTGGGNVLCVLFLLPVVVYLISLSKLQQDGMIEGPRILLFSGIAVECLSYLCALLGINLLFHLFNGQDRIILILIAIVGYILTIVFCGYLYKRAIKKRVYSKERNNSASASIICFVALGMVVSRTIIKNLDGNAFKAVPGVLFLLLSYATSTGIFNIYRYLYIKSHPDILDRLEKE